MGSLVNTFTFFRALYGTEPGFIELRSTAAPAQFAKAAWMLAFIRVPAKDFQN